MKQSLSKLIRLYRQELIILSLAIMTFLIFVPVFTYAYFASDLKTPETIMNRNNTGIVLLDRNGEPFFRFYEGKYSEYVPLNKIPREVTQAVIAAEDKDFYSHPGFSISSIFAAFIANIKNGELAFGGSTITQQLVKNSLLKPRKSFLRKYQELILAEEIERRYTKDQILEMYLNSVYFGEGAFGIESASETYFGKSSSELNLAEASLLAGILTAPSKYSPLSGNLEQAIDRQRYVLDQMVEQNMISKERLNTILNTKLTFAKSSESPSYLAPHFALMVRDQLVEKYGEEQVARSGFVIRTTLDLDWQKTAQHIVQEQMERLSTQGATNASAVVIDPKTGEVRVLIGSKDWSNEEFGKVNMATTPRQPGSSFKPIVYSLALEQRLITPATVLQDRKTTFQGNYTPLNYDRRFRGPVLVRRALANSLNIPAVLVLQKVGVEETLVWAKNLGISTLSDPSNYGLSLVLGSGQVKLTELTNVYATFANEGKYNPVTLISTIQDKTGHVIYRYSPQPKQVIEPSVAFLISSMLSDNNARSEAFGDALTITRPAAVKTGTTDDYRDALTLGYTSQLAVGVWVGNNDNAPMNSIAGSLGAAPIWKEMMETYLRSQPVVEFKAPSGVRLLPICRNNGYLLRTRGRIHSGVMMEYFLEGTEPTRTCTVSPPTPSPSVTPSPDQENHDKKDDQKDSERRENNGRGQDRNDWHYFP